MKEKYRVWYDDDIGRLRCNDPWCIICSSKPWKFMMGLIIFLLIIAYLFG